MAEQDIDQTVDIPEPEVPPADPATWRERYLKNWMDARLGHEGMMMAKIGQQNEVALRTALKAADGTIGSGHAAEMEDMATSVSIGNTYNYQGGADTNQQSQISNRPATPASPKQESTIQEVSADIQSKIPMWLKAALLGLGGSAGGLLGAYAFSDSIPTSTPGTPPALVDTDTDTRSKVTIKR